MLRDVTSAVHSGGVLTLTSIQSWPGLKFARLQTVAATLFTRIGKNNITIVVQNEERVKSIGAFVRSLEPCKFCCLFSTTFVFSWRCRPTEQNMSADALSEVELTEADIPGAILEEPLEAHTESDGYTHDSGP